MGTSGPRRGSKAAGAQVKAYAWATHTFDAIMREHFLATIPASGLDLQLTIVDDMGDVGDYGSDSSKALGLRRNRALLDILRTETEPFLACDVDIRFYGPVVENLLVQLWDADIAFQDDSPLAGGWPCLGFMVVRPSQFTLAFFSELVAESQRQNAHDQTVVKDVLAKPASMVKWKYLDERYWTVGRNGKVWSPGDAIPDPPPNMLAHHGNWTIGADNKLTLLDAVMEKHENR